ncbi:hypothetical protein C8A03DRAFT_11898 [Achaetomium macrosporum]|uniref:Extracellular membrane protein CFEM domain-containing protein n=1 Tax=Achaetomium macrosporum TaxID=79813 RepID=A0AAN7CHG3_9PEZI|nr:hypothetical protein C8A03DRAFT_11898 [Achaetomium macrosporum]
MASQGRRLSSRWGWLLMTASTASAFSLFNVEPIVSTTIPISCVLAYYSIIPGCSVNDFIGGDECSAGCVNGLKRIQSNVQEACSDADVPSNSVLGQVLRGNLVELLCPDTSSEPQTSSSSRSPTAAPTTVTVGRTSTSTPALIFTTVRSTSTSSTTSTQTEEPDTSISSISSTATSDTTITTAVESSAPTSEPSSSSPSMTASPQPTSGSSSDENSSGGGSPFDIASSDSSHLSACGMRVAIIVLSLYLILFR